MNFPKKALLGSLLVMSASSAFAVDTATLKVIGSIAPTACTPNFAGGGVVDYGLITSASLSATATTKLASHDITYNIHCDDAISITTGWSDNRAGTAINAAYSSFGLGSQGTAKIGYYSIMQKNTGATGDGAPVDIIFRDNPANGWGAIPAAGLAMTQGFPRVVSYAPTGTLVPGLYNDFGGTLEITASIAATSTLDLTSSATLDGLSTLTVSYL